MIQEKSPLFQMYLFEHRAKFSSNPGRSEPSQCPVLPSAFVLGSLPLQLPIFAEDVKNMKITTEARKLQTLNKPVTSH